MGFYNVVRLEDGRLLVTASATPEDDGVFADLQYYVEVDDPSYAELEREVGSDTPI